MQDSMEQCEVALSGESSTELQLAATRLLTGVLCFQFKQSLKTGTKDEAEKDTKAKGDFRLTYL